MNDYLMPMVPASSRSSCGRFLRSIILGFTLVNNTILQDYHHQTCSSLGLKMKLKNEANYFVVLYTTFTTRLKFEIKKT